MENDELYKELLRIYNLFRGKIIIRYLENDDEYNHYLQSLDLSHYIKELPKSDYHHIESIGYFYSIFLTTIIDTDSNNFISGLLYLNDLSWSWKIIGVSTFSRINNIIRNNPLLYNKYIDELITKAKNVININTDIKTNLINIPLEHSIINMCLLIRIIESLELNEA